MFSFFVTVCRSDSFENPSLQKHYSNLEALALDMMAPEETEDLISKNPFAPPPDIACIFIPSFILMSLSFFASVPKVDQIDARLGGLIQEFKDLVYPADYNPESKPAAKRKTGNDRGLFPQPVG